MVAYEFYWNDSNGKEYLIGILPERRKNPKRITQKSVLNWGKLLLADNADKKHIVFKKVIIGESTGKFIRLHPSLKTY